MTEKKTFRQLLLDLLEARVNRAKAEKNPKETSVEFSFKFKRK